MRYCVVITTCAKKEEAEALAAKILEKKLAACVQLSEIQSFYEWDGKICNVSEIKLMLKTRTVLYPQLEACIVENHRYDVPEIIQLPIHAGLNAYLNWLNDVTQGGDAEE
ncbi:CutA1 divalent ion tolerance protein [Chloroherpeton thalassium ATCC 35110]|uniref:CutA1 divalent ion tolerance protein n=1 Tax=Chloroherpeton thalassium (strain ATCC 35110 / GB-78) TaxID=517418 RepID=B3QYW0_CHLT3|nr:divalent-cation tolerance protein CutA [Chloroherpeton thalassium]ACF13653.1 CutA1 divalent ion tolerance protein [Chloroherpeton thalassium ATCC 35110]